MNVKKYLTSLALVTALAIPLGACSSAPQSGNASPSADASAPASSTSASAAAAPKKIAFLQTHNDNAFMAYLAETLVATAKANGLECDHITAGGDEATQLSQIEQAISSGNYAGIVCEATGDGVINGFKEAKEAGLPVIILHEGVSDYTYVDCVVMCSLAETGYQAIKLEREQLGEGFNLAIVNGSEGHGATVAIHEGYERALKEFPDINVVFEGAGNWNAEDAMSLTETWFASGKQIDGIVCMNDGMAKGVRQVMKDNGVLGTVPIYSNDCEDHTLAAIEAGEQSGSFDMNAEALCNSTIENMLKLINKEPIAEKMVSVDPLLVTKDNLAEYRATHSASY